MDHIHSHMRAVVPHSTIACAVCVACLVLGATDVGATPIATQLVRSAPNFFDGIAFDSVTGNVYELPGYGPGFGRTGNTFAVYSSVAQFEVGTASGSVTTSTTWGTYAVAQSGQLFARTATTSDSFGFPAGAQLTQFSATTGATVQTIAPPALGGTNGTDSFDWGGFSAIDALSDGSHIYVVSHTASAAPQDWTVDTYDFSLDLLDTSHVVLPAGPGYAFAIDGDIFFGDHFNSGHVSARVDASTGALTGVDFTLGPLGSTYVNNTAYSASTDTLYLVSAGNYYKVSDATAVFGLESVPEPGTLVLLASGLAAVGYIRRPRFATRR